MVNSEQYLANQLPSLCWDHSASNLISQVLNQVVFPHIISSQLVVNLSQLVIYFYAVLFVCLLSIAVFSSQREGFSKKKEDKASEEHNIINLDITDLNNTNILTAVLRALLCVCVCLCLCLCLCLFGNSKTHNI
jgi:hypothetical protein